MIPALVVAEATYFVGPGWVPAPRPPFSPGIADVEVEAALPDDWPRMAELVQAYADFPLGGTDASVIALAERLGASLVVTLDRRHCAAFDILPA